jgi:hypothetical protein
MYKFLKQWRPNRFGAMETETIQKNGARPKSRRVGEILLVLIFLLLILSYADTAKTLI